MRLTTSPFVKYVIATILVAFGVSYIVAKRNVLVSQIIEDGSEFKHPEDANASWAGPPIGERIDLTHFKDEYGVPLSQVIGEGLSMLVLVDPECGAAKAASNQLSLVQEAVTKAGVNYYLISVTSTAPPAEFQKYAHSFSSDTRAYLWLNEAAPPPKLYSMVLPSHILIDRDGVIIHKWPGTSMFEGVREKMAKEIFTDTIAELTSRKTRNR